MASHSLGVFRREGPAATSNDIRKQVWSMQELLCSPQKTSGQSAVVSGSRQPAV